MRTMIVRMAALCLFLVLGSATAWAEQGLFFKDEKGAVPAPVLGTTVEIQVTGIIARARVTQIFENPSGDWVEGIYIFPLPEEGAVDTLKMKIGERILVGEIQEKAKAQQTYETAKEEGRKASLIEQQRPDVFTTSVANIGPGETVEITIEMQQVVRWEAGRFRLRFPTVVAPRYSPPRTEAALKREEDRPLASSPVLSAGSAPVNPFALHVDLATGFPLGRVESSTHEVVVEKGTRHRYAVDLAKGVAPADGDFILEWTPAVGREPRAVFYSEEMGGERYDLLMVMPPDAPDVAGTRLPRETIFVVDNSYSMQGESIEQARRALLLGLGRLQPGDWFNVIEFHDTTKALFPAPVPADPQHLKTARHYVETLQVASGTVMLPALEMAFSEKEKDLVRQVVRQVIFITDGQADNEAELFRCITEKIGDRRLFTVAIGSAPNVSFMRKAAELGRGTFTHIASIPEVAQRMDTLFAQLEAPMLQDIEVRWADPAAEAWPARIPDLYLGEPLIVIARRGASSGPVEISGRRGGEVWQDSFSAAAELQGAGIDKLWARRKIDALLDSLHLQAAAQASETHHLEVHQAVVDLGLRHHLVTPYTSLVAVDVTPTAPAGTVPARRPVPVNPPRGSEFSLIEEGAQMSESIMVTAESPILDERKLTLGATVSQDSLERIPASHDPWAVLQTTPGVLTDRINVGVNESGQARMAIGQGAAGDQNTWVIDGLVVTDLSALGSSPAYYDFDSFEEITATTGGADTVLETPGVRINLVTKRGTNEWSGSAHFLGGGDALGEREGHGLESLLSGSAELGGPFRKDRFWIWGSLQHDEIDRNSLGGQRQESLLENGSFKVNSQLSSSNAATLFWKRGDVSVSGFGASPVRAPETTWDRDGRDEIWKIEDTQIFGPSLYVSVQLGSTDRKQTDTPLGGLAGEARIDAAGIAHGTWFGLAGDDRTKLGELSGSYFFNSGQLSHELKTGVSWRGQDSRFLLAAPSRIEVAEETLEPANATRVVEVWQGGEARTETETASAWVQDVATLGNATFNLGLRFDEQDLGIPGRSSGEIKSRTLAPRLGMSYTLGPERRTLLKASVARFASRLGTGPAFRLDPNVPATAYFFSTVEGDQPWYSVNRDPLLGTNPNAVAPDLAPEITDELAFGVEHSLRSDLLIGFQGTWRRTQDVLEERLLVRDGNGKVFVATSADWVLSTAAVPVFDLRPGLTWTGGTLLTNGDREQDYLGFSLFWNKRLAYRWMSRGHITWSDWTWRVGPGFERYDDPTRALGGGDRDGDPVAVPASALDRPHAADQLITGGWAFHWEGFYQFFPDLKTGFNAALAVNGREGYPTAWYRQVVRERAGLARVPVAEIGSSRGDDVITVDARLEKEILLGDFGLTLGLDVFNLLNEDAALWREADLGTSRAGLANDAVASRTYRLGLKVTWR